VSYNHGSMVYFWTRNFKFEIVLQNSFKLQSNVLSNRLIS